MRPKLLRILSIALFLDLIHAYQSLYEESVPSTIVSRWLHLLNGKSAGEANKAPAKTSGWLTGWQKGLLYKAGQGGFQFAMLKASHWSIFNAAYHPRSCHNTFAKFSKL